MSTSVSTDHTATMAEPSSRSPRRLTLFGRSTLLISAVLVANVVCWVIAGLTFRKTGLISLALLAWTLGLRHGLDADHISAIDNATRHLVSLDQLPVTCGLWFSLGHSTIVIAVNIAIAISVQIYDKLDAVGEIGGTVGTAISAVFLFLIAVINIFFLHTAIKTKRRIETGQSPVAGPGENPVQGGGFMVRLIGPVLKAVDRPWKLYPVGLLFGLGFDTASSIALLAISALAQKGPNGKSINHARIIILPFLFTAGMSLVDSLDSVLMLYAYASPSRFTPEGKIGLFQSSKIELDEEADRLDLNDVPSTILPGDRLTREVADIDPAKDGKAQAQVTEDVPILPILAADQGTQSPSSPGNQAIDKKTQVISSLSVTLTALSIIVALSISIIEIMGLVGEKCQSCKEAAEAEDGGGLAGSWWRAWGYANDQSGLIGAGIVGTFVLILVVYHGGQWLSHRRESEIHLT